jgi:hypothetical protein
LVAQPGYVADGEHDDDICGYVIDDDGNTSGKAGAQIPHLPLGDDSSPWGR